MSTETKTAYSGWIKRWEKGSYVCVACGPAAFRVQAENHGDGRLTEHVICHECGAEMKTVEYGPDHLILNSYLLK